MKTMSAMILSLLLTTPAWALDYTNTASFDWGHMTFRGISTTLTIPAFGVNQNLAANVSSPTAPSRAEENTGLQDVWSNETATASIAGVGSGTAVTTSSTLTASSLLSAAGDAGGYIARVGDLVANESGTLTVSIPYLLEQSLAPLQGLTTTTMVDLALGEQRTQAILGLGVPSEQGALTLSRVMHIGDIAELYAQIIAGSSATGGGSVPIPNLYWPSLLSMIGLVLLGGWRQSRDWLNRCWPLGMLVVLLPQWALLEPSLQDLTTWLIQGWLALVNIPYVLEAPHRVVLASGTWTIDPDCAGLRYLVPGLALAYLFATWRYARVIQRFTFLVGCAVVLILANGLRAFGVIAGSHWGLTVGADHRVFSYVIFGAALLGLAWMAKGRSLWQ